MKLGPLSLLTPFLALTWSLSFTLDSVWAAPDGSEHSGAVVAHNQKGKEEQDVKAAEGASREDESPFIRLLIAEYLYTYPISPQTGSIPAFSGSIPAGQVSFPTELDVQIVIPSPDPNRYFMAEAATKAELNGMDPMDDTADWTFKANSLSYHKIYPIQTLEKILVSFEIEIMVMMSPRRYAGTVCLASESSKSCLPPTEQE